eukprot:3093252-Pyramimonas_sp.AAC.1
MQLRDLTASLGNLTFSPDTYKYRLTVPRNASRLTLVPKLWRNTGDNLQIEVRLALVLRPSGLHADIR